METVFTNVYENKTWGDNGYIKIAKGEKYNFGSGQCGILLSASYPVL